MIEDRIDEENKYYVIPANYTDSGKCLGGLLSIRNAIESLIVVLMLGYIEGILIPMNGTVRIIVMVLTILPIGLITMMGIDGDSLFQYVGHVFKFMKRKRKLHLKKAEKTDE